MKPPAPESALMVIETARMPGLSIAAMKPAASPCTMAVLVMGWPGDQRHAHHRAFHRVVDARPDVMGDEVESTDAAGHFCQRT